MKNASLKRSISVVMCFVLAAVCFAYGVVVLAVRSGTGFFAVWFAIGAFFAACAVVVALNMHSKIPKIFIKIGLFFAAIFLSSFFTIESFIISVFFSNCPPDLDYIIVLGAQVYPQGPSVVLQYRLDEAVKYLKKNLNTACIVSGGQGGNEPFAEAIGMKKYLENSGIESSRIIEELESKNTEQNIKNSMKYIKADKSVGIVTNNFHMFRALQIAKKQGLAGACGLVAGMNNLYLPNNILREYFGELKFLISQIGG